MLLPLNWRLTPAELAYQLDDAEPVVLAGLEHEHSETATLAARACRRRLEELAASTERAIPDAAADGDGLLLVYTSGTTGRPKGALLTHANCFWTNLSFDRVAGLADDDVVLQVLPQFHCGGWNVQPLLAWWKGATRRAGAVLRRRARARADRRRGA